MGQKADIGNAVCDFCDVPQPDQVRCRKSIMWD
jgi:hypothetical protein